MRKEYQLAFCELKAALPTFCLSAALYFFTCIILWFFCTIEPSLPSGLTQYFPPPETGTYFFYTPLSAFGLLLLACGFAIVSGGIPFLSLPLLLSAWGGMDAGTRLSQGMRTFSLSSLPALAAFCLCCALGTRICWAVTRRLTPAPRRIRRGARRGAKPLEYAACSLRVFLLVVVPLAACSFALAFLEHGL